MTSTHTLATMAVSPGTHAEIRRHLETVGYGHAILSDFASGAPILDMTGIGLVLDTEATAPGRETVAAIISRNLGTREGAALAIADEIIAHGVQIAGTLPLEDAQGHYIGRVFVEVTDAVLRCQCPGLAVKFDGRGEDAEPEGFMLHPEGGRLGAVAEPRPDVSVVIKAQIDHAAVRKWGRENFAEQVGRMAGGGAGEAPTDRVPPAGLDADERERWLQGYDAAAGPAPEIDGEVLGEAIAALRAFADRVNIGAGGRFCRDNLLGLAATLSAAQGTPNADDLIAAKGATLYVNRGLAKFDCYTVEGHYRDGPTRALVYYARPNFGGGVRTLPADRCFLSREAWLAQFQAEDREEAPSAAPIISTLCPECHCREGTGHEKTCSRRFAITPPSGGSGVEPVSKSRLDELETAHAELIERVRKIEGYLVL